MRFLEDLGAPLPQALQTAADIVLGAQIIRELHGDHIDVERLRHLIDEARARNVNVFNSDLAYAVKGAMERLMQAVATTPEDLATLKMLEDLARLLRPLPLNLNLWKVQNSYYEAMQTVTSWYQKKAAEGDETARAWLENFRAVGNELNFAVNHLQV